MIRWIKNNGLGLALTIAVVISIVCSGIIWLNPERTGGSFQRANNDNSTQQMSAQTLGNIYLPTQVVATNSHGIQFLKYGQRKNVVLTVREAIERWGLSRMTTVRTNNSDVYLSYLRSPNSLMLSYPDRVPTEIFNSAFSTDLNASRAPWINHIVIPFDGSDSIYLMSDKNYAVYRARISSGSLSRLRNLARGGNRIPVDYRIVNGSAVLMSRHSFRLPVYGYQVTTKSADNLIQNLLSATNLSSLNNRINGNVTTYLSGANRQVAYNHSLGTLTYQNFQSRNNDESTSELFNNLYSRLNGIGADLENVRYDSFNEAHSIITYRSFVNGFPIYNNNGYGEFKMQSTKSGLERYQLSVYSIQVPLPINSAKVKLPSSTTVLDQLRQSGKYPGVRNMRIGYSWQTQTKGARSDAVRLVPTYYVNYRGNWVDYQTLIK